MQRAGIVLGVTFLPSFVERVILLEAEGYTTVRPIEVHEILFHFLAHPCWSALGRPAVMVNLARGLDLQLHCLH